MSPEPSDAATAAASRAEHVRQVIAAAGKLTDSDVEQLRGLLGLPCRCHHQHTDAVPTQRRRRSRAGEATPA